MAEIGIPYILETPRGDLFFNGFDQEPSSGFVKPYFRLTDVEGLDGAAIRAPTESRPQKAGLIAFAFLEGGMFPALKGRIIPRDFNERRLMEDQLRGNVRSMLNTDGLLKWRPTAAQVEWSLPLTITNAITDAMRALSNEGDGGPFNDDTTGLWEGTTNLVSNDGFEVNTTGWTQVSSTLTRVTLGPQKFQSACGQVVTSNLVANEGAFTTFVASGTAKHTISAWVAQSGAAGGTVRIRLADNAGTTIATGTSTAMQNGAYVRLTLTSPANLTSGTTYRLYVETDVKQSITYFIDGVQAEQKLIATPYRPSGFGARPAVTAVGEGGPTGGPGQPSASAQYGVLQPNQGWLHLCLRPGWAHNNAPYGSGRVTLWQWRSDATHYIELYYDPAQAKFVLARRNGGATDTALSPAVTFAAGATISVTAEWTSTSLTCAFNGVPGSVALSSSSTVFLGGVDWTVGYGSGANDYLDGDVHWLAGGLGPLSDADVTALHGEGAAGDAGGLTHFRPGASLLSDSSAASILWKAHDSVYLVVQERRLGVRAFEVPQITSEGVFKDFRLGLIAADPVVQSEVEYTLSDTVSAFAVDLENAIDGSYTGLAEVYPVVRVTAGATLANVDVQNDDAAKKVRLLALGLTTGQWVEIDFLYETITKSDGTDLSGKLDVANSEFWFVSPGSTDTISLQAISGTVTRLDVFWRFRFAG